MKLLSLFFFLISGASLGITSDGFFELDSLPKSVGLCNLPCVWIVFSLSCCEQLKVCWFSLQTHCSGGCWLHCSRNGRDPVHAGFQNIPRHPPDWSKNHIDLVCDTLSSVKPQTDGDAVACPFHTFSCRFFGISTASSAQTAPKSCWTLALTCGRTLRSSPCVKRTRAWRWLSSPGTQRRRMTRRRSGPSRK